MRKSQARQILSQNNSVKTQGMKNEIMKFLGFSKIWRQDSKIYFSKKKKIFFGNIFERKFSPDFGENTRFHFFIPCVLAEIFSRRKRFLSSPKSEIEKSRDSQINRLFLRQDSNQFHNCFGNIGDDLRFQFAQMPPKNCKLARCHAVDFAFCLDIKFQTFFLLLFSFILQQRQNVILKNWFYQIRKIFFPVVNQNKLANFWTLRSNVGNKSACNELCN